jgi:hypothetical protein
MDAIGRSPSLATRWWSNVARVHGTKRFMSGCAGTTDVRADGTRRLPESSDEIRIDRGGDERRDLFPCGGEM